LLGANGSPSPYEVNVSGTANLFHAMREARSGARVLVSSSSAVYGDTAKPPIDEDSPFRPATDYAASKAAQEMVAIGNQCRGADVVRVRPFNLVGPRQPRSLVTATIAVQIVRAERAGQGAIRVGNTASKRDYTDVRDAVRAYVAIAEGADLDDVFNVCSGKATSIQECLEALISMSSVPLSIESDIARLRSGDVKEQVGSAARVEAATGWRPTISLTASLTDLLEDCRSRYEALV
jgi:GDP-4-dehydro-6-deoxy-D-mannose reductase